MVMRPTGADEGRALHTAVLPTRMTPVFNKRATGTARGLAIAIEEADVISATAIASQLSPRHALPLHVEDGTTWQ